MTAEVLFEISHPKHFLQFRPLIESLGRDRSVHVIARHKDVLIPLLTSAGIDFETYNRPRHGLAAKAWGAPAVLREYSSILRRVNPRLVISRSSPYAAFLGRFSRARTVVMPDSEGVVLNERFTIPLSDYVVTPPTMERDYGDRHFRVSGFFEAAYLHPDVFQRDSSISTALGLTSDERYCLLRFVAWGANHDRGQIGIAPAHQIRAVEELSRHLRVFVSAEGPLPESLEGFRLAIDPSKLHQVLAGASLYLGDSQSMATEAALLGTPAVRCNSFVGPTDFSNFRVLEHRYDLLHNFRSPDDAIHCAVNLARSRLSKQQWMAKRERYFQSIGDVNRETVEILERLI